MNQEKAEHNTDEKPRAKKKKAFGIDAVTGHLVIGSLRIPMPHSRAARISIGVFLVIFGLFGFLPILGFWMLPLGFIVLAQDIPAVKRLERKISVWWEKRRRRHNPTNKSTNHDMTLR